MLDKYTMKSLDEYKKDFGESVDTEIGYYQTFLTSTDYISNKIIEEYVSGKSKAQVLEKYKDILDARNFARDKLRELEGE